MEPVTVEDLAKRQKEFANRLRKQIEAAEKGKRATPERLIQNHEGQLAALKAELNAAISAREAAVRRYDADIARKREDVGTLERELDEIKLDLEAEEKKTAAKNSKSQPGRKGAAKTPAAVNEGEEPPS